MKIKFIVLVSLCISTLGFSVEFINSGTGIAMVAIPSADSINVGGGKVTSVKDGEISSTSTDAVNGSQLFGIGDEITNINNDIANIEGDITNIDNDIASIDNDIANINNDITAIKYQISDLERKASAGTAAAIAMANLPQPIEAGEEGIAVGTGVYSNSAAVALGYSRTSKTGKEVLKISASYDTNNKIGVGMGVFIRLNKK